MSTHEVGTREEVVQVRGLTARAGSAPLLHGVHMTAAAGQVTALVGPSGSGKTTTALALLGEAAPGVELRGTVRVAGVDVVDAHGVTADAPAVRGGTLAYMPQHPGDALNPVRRTGAVLRELARLHGRVDRAGGLARARAALEAAQLPSDRQVLRRLPHEFSGGQRQRVALAQVLACRPRALVLDEPSTGLDTVTRLGLVRELSRLADDGLAILLLTHDRALVDAVADHVLVLDGGHLATGPPAPRPLAAPTVQVPAPRTVSAPPAPPALRVRGLTAWLRPRGRDTVLRDIDLDVPAGGCLGLAGPSGGGKTTLARCVAGLHARHTGAVLLDGTPLPPPLRSRDRETRRRVQYVWQETRGSFDERRTVLDQVARTAVRLRELPPTRAAEEAADLLERLGVDAATARRGPEGLSGGELQRAAFARAALALPRVLVCDEITTALDPAATERVLAELRRLRDAHGTAVLWISHDLALTRRLAARTAVLDAGRIVEQGPTDEVLTAPASDTAGLLLRAESLPPRAARTTAPGHRPAAHPPPPPERETHR
ncbi:ABC transporter ATP-binding protein [Streptomyces sp. NPDC050560]|uniref:ABC transporter ATP-binding protein n=1 Tax=Streptomyces sp. NPDC050560 TaxID=3365630 RepID=UPI00379E0F9D